MGLHTRREIGGSDRRRCDTTRASDQLQQSLVGPVRLGFSLVATPQALRFELVRSWLFGLPLPPALWVRVEAVMTGRAGSWWVDVRAEAPLLGRLVRYEGEVVPE